MSATEKEIFDNMTILFEEHIKQKFDFMKLVESFPTTSEFDKKIEDMFYTPCLKLDDKILGYTGYKDDILDIGYDYFIPKNTGVNLWVLIYDIQKNTWMFSFVKTQNYSEIGTKHAMLLHQIAKSKPDAKLIMAGEVDYRGNVMRWNNMSGTLTKKMFESSEFMEKVFANMFGTPRRPIKFIIGPLIETLASGNPVMEQFFSKNRVTNMVAHSYRNTDVISNILSNLTLRAIAQYVLPKAIPDIEHVVVYSQNSNFILEDASLVKPLSEYAPSLCGKHRIRRHLYLYDDATTCKNDIDNVHPTGMSYCPRD